MGMLKKSGPDIDFTLLQRRGIIRKPKEVKAVLDLTKSPGASPLETQVSQTQTAAVNPLSFLDAPATSSGIASFFDNSSSVSNTQLQNLSSNNISAEKLVEIDNLKVQVENLEFKLERLLEKFDLVSSKLAEFERKVL